MNVSAFFNFLSCPNSSSKSFAVTNSDLSYSTIPLSNIKSCGRIVIGMTKHCLRCSEIYVIFSKFRTNENP